MLIDTEAALAQGVCELRRLDPLMDELAASGVHPPLRTRVPGFAGLVSIVIGQQVSTASAAAILGRLAATLPEFSAEGVARISDEALLAAGLSRPKLKTLRSVSRAVLDGMLQLDGLARADPGVAHETLTAIHGIGPWTADIYLMFCLGHPDVFPAGDLALQESARVLLDLPGRPAPAALAAIAAARWPPWRSIAAGMLWAHYRQLKPRPGAPVAS